MNVDDVRKPYRDVADREGASPSQYLPDHKRSPA